jgi:hypothetical protein
VAGAEERTEKGPGDPAGRYRLGAEPDHCERVRFLTEAGLICVAGTRLLQPAVITAKEKGYVR